MLDDGWRHLSMAFNQEQLGSWGEVFIHSLYKEYDPWFMWHKLLFLIGTITSEEKVHILINGFVYAALSSWFFIVLKKYSKFNLFFILLFSFLLPIMCTRYFSLRPDILSGLFLLYFMLIEKKYLMVLLSLLYMPFYYVFWFYFGYIGILKLFLKKYKDFIILFILGLIGLTFHLSYDFQGYIDITKNVLQNDTLLQGYAVGESKPFLIPLEIKNYMGSTLLLLFLLLLSYLFYQVFKPKNRILELLILFMPLIFLQARFYALLFPLISVYILILAHKFYSIMYENSLIYAITQVIEMIKNRSYFGNISKKSLKFVSYLIVISVLLLTFLGKITFYKKFQNEINNIKFIKENEFKNKKILFSTMESSLYISMYKNPHAKYIPSCSLGWIDYKDKELKNIYFKLVTNGSISQKDFFKFLDFNKIDVIIINNNSSKLSINNKQIIKNGYEFYKLYKNKIIFIKN